MLMLMFEIISNQKQKQLLLVSIVSDYGFSKTNYFKLGPYAPHGVKRPK